MSNLVQTHLDFLEKLKIFRVGLEELKPEDQLRGEDKMTMNEVIIVVTTFVTYVFGILAKKFKWVKSKYIPIQNLFIGVIAGILTYFTGLTENLASGIIICTASALTAGGTYDLLKAGEKV